ncbi:hypothetical protein [Citrobacter farmeri]
MRKYNAKRRVKLVYFK